MPIFASNVNTEINNSSPLPLVPCPFCKQLAQFFQVGDMESVEFGAYGIACTNSLCGASMGLMYSTGDDCRPILAERWNKCTDKGE